MHVLAAYLLTAMVAWVPLSYHHVFDRKEQVTRDRYESIAEDIAAVSLDPAQKPLFADVHSKVTGELVQDGRMETALLLTSIASWESHFEAAVDSCELVGDNGHAFSMWQMHQPRARVCGDRRAAIRVAIGMIRESFDSCNQWGAQNRIVPVLADKLSFYTDGYCHTNWKRSRERMERAIGWWKEHAYVALADAN